MYKDWWSGGRTTIDIVHDNVDDDDDDGEDKDLFKRDTTKTGGVEVEP